MIFGLLFATVITLVVVPVMYLLNEKLRAKFTGIDPDANVIPAQENSRRRGDCGGHAGYFWPTPKLHLAPGPAAPARPGPVWCVGQVFTTLPTLLCSTPTWLKPF